MKDTCKCSMSIRMLGDGCSICNPEYYAEILKEQYEDTRNDWREDISLEMRHDIMTDVDAFPDDWHMLAEYFTHI